MEIGKILAEQTKEFWRAYIFHPEKLDEEFLYTWWDKNSIVIGTGKHELLIGVEALLQYLEQEVVQPIKDIEFEIIEEWVNYNKVSEECYIVYGTLHIKEAGAEEKEVFVDMDTRYSVTYFKREEQFKICCVHQSVPFVDQKEGEIYPKTMTEIAKTAMNYASEMEYLAKTDSMTGLYNNRFFKEKVKQYLEENQAGFLYMIDINKFKQINDNYGHPVGDQIIIQVASIIKANLQENDIAGRVGGDEFAIFASHVKSEEEARAFGNDLIEQFKVYKKQYPKCPQWGLSIGATKAQLNQKFDEIQIKADFALYEAKSSYSDVCHIK